MRAIIAWSWGSLRVWPPDTSSGGGQEGSGQGFPRGPGGDLGGPDPSLPRGLGVQASDPGDQVARTLQDQGSRRVDLTGFEGSGGYPGKRRFSVKKPSFRRVDLGGGLEGFLGGFGRSWGYLARTLKNLEKPPQTGGPGNRLQR